MLVPDLKFGRDGKYLSFYIPSHFFEAFHLSVRCEGRDTLYLITGYSSMLGGNDMAISDIFFRPSFFTLILFVVIYAAYSHVKRNQRLPKGLPWGQKDERVKSASSVQDKLLKLKELV